jgi:hypothetical protein
VAVLFPAGGGKVRLRGGASGLDVGSERVKRRQSMRAHLFGHPE